VGVSFKGCSSTRPRRCPGQSSACCIARSRGRSSGADTLVDGHLVEGETLESVIHKLAAGDRAYHELLCLCPAIAPRPTLKDTLLAVIEEAPTPPLKVKNRHQPPVPAELNHYVMRGLAKSPNDRYQSVAEMREVLQRVEEGTFAVQCPLTFMKRTVHGANHVVDRHPMHSVSALALAALTVVGGGGLAIWSLF